MDEKRKERKKEKSKICGWDLKLVGLVESGVLDKKRNGVLSFVWTKKKNRALILRMDRGCTRQEFLAV